MQFAFKVIHTAPLRYGKDSIIPWLLGREIILILLWLILVFSLFLIVRPSIGKKDISYFLSKKKWFFYFMISIFALWVCILILGFHPSTFTIIRPDFPLLLFFSPFFVVWVLFFLDSQPTLFNLGRCLVRSCKLIIYMVPFFLIVGLIPSMLILSALNIPVYVNILLPFFFCLMSAFYTKAVHDHYDLFK